MNTHAPSRTVYLGLPAFNEEQAISPLFDRIRTAQSELTTRGLCSDLQVIFYDDGSTDGTVQQVRLNAGNLKIHLLSPESNGGLGVAMRGLINAFLERANGDDVLVVMDTDDTHDPAQIAELLVAVDDRELDVVIASRYRKGAKTLGVPGYRQILSLGFAGLVSLMLPIRGVRDYSCGYRVYRYSALAAVSGEMGFPIEETGFAAMPEILVRMRGKSISFGEVPLKLAYDRRLTVSKMRAWQNSTRLLSRIWSWKFAKKGDLRQLLAGDTTRCWWQAEEIN